MPSSTVMVDMVSKATFLVAIRLHLKTDAQVHELWRLSENDDSQTCENKTMQKSLNWVICQYGGW